MSGTIPNKIVGLFVLMLDLMISVSQEIQKNIIISKYNNIFTNDLM